jgi:hypothetical protein
MVMMKTLTSLAFVAGCAITLTLSPAQAQTMDTQILTTTPRHNPGDRADRTINGNNMESAQYERLLQNNLAFRQSRMLKECGPITDVQLRLRCEDSFNAVEDEPSLGWNEQMTGGSSGTMNATGATPYRPDMYDAGAGR